MSKTKSAKSFMLSIEEIRKVLPDKGKDLSDEQITKLSADMYALADICFDMWLADRKKKSGASNDLTPKDS